jgi:predicted ATPase/DNA-binding CsgD family transcriptional regulator
MKGEARVVRAGGPQHTGTSFESPAWLRGQHREVKSQPTGTSSPLRAGPAGHAFAVAPAAAMVTAVSRSAVAEMAGGMHGFPVALTSFVGRAQEVAEVAGQLSQSRLVTMTGPGGAGKTRLAGEVARRVASRFADGVWLAELAAVRDPDQVPAAVAVALGIRDLPAVEVADALAGALARRQLLLVLDNCEQVIGAAAELCGRLLHAADEVRVLATSREPLRIAGEARYRLGPLTLPEPGDAAAAASCEAVTLFADRAARADPGFALDESTQATVARLVTRLDGMPLAIELAAARVDALGVAQLLDRIDDRFELLTDGDRLAELRQRSLAAAVHWSYVLLDNFDRRVFRAVSAFPGPFTLEGAEAVAGDGAGQAVLRLTDCSLLVPPTVGPDGRTRYAMLETLRAYAAGLLAEADDDGEATAALAAYAAKLAAEASEGLQTGTTEMASLRHLDAEDATVSRALAWAMDHDPGTALRLALALEPWWQIRGRLAGNVPLLVAAAEYAEPDSDEWCLVRLCLGQAAAQSGDPGAALTHFTAVRDALEDAVRAASPVRPAMLSACLGGRSGTLSNTGRVAEAVDDGRRALDLARETGQPGLEALALACLSVATWRGGDRDGAFRLARQAQQLPGDVAGALQRALSQLITMVLAEAGDVAAAEQACTAGLAWCRDAGDLTSLAGQLWNRVILDLRASRTGDAAAHLRELLEIAMQTGVRPALLAGLDCCGHLCAASGSHAEAVTMWAAMSALEGPGPLLFPQLNAGRRHKLLRAARELLGESRTRAAEQRGKSMSPATAAQYALMLTAAEAQPSAAAGSAAVPDLARLSPRERELVILVAQGRTNAQIAAQLYITVHTVSSHLDRIRDKTGCRRRADLTRLALSAGLV